MNFVVLSAALSGANANLYLVSRTLFSMARAGHVPAAVGNVNRRGTPVNAVLTSSLGLGLALLVQWRWPETAYVWFVGVALFGALFVWTMIFLVHLRFRAVWTGRARRRSPSAARSAVRGRSSARPLPRGPVRDDLVGPGPSLDGVRGGPLAAAAPRGGVSSVAAEIGLRPMPFEPPERSTSPTTSSTPGCARDAATAPPSSAASAGSPTARSRRSPTASAMSSRRSASSRSSA